MERIENMDFDKRIRDQVLSRSPTSTATAGDGERLD